ncbi:MAG: zinc-ribbon domain-containing protein [Ruminococcus sp.]|nr:zinc-ribbon domain-containing protein [Ruminococcus sp.]
MKYCPECNEPNEMDSLFCENCGHPLSEVKSEPVGPQQEHSKNPKPAGGRPEKPIPPEKKETSSPLLIVALALGILLCVVLIFLGISLLKDKKYEISQSAEELMLRNDSQTTETDDQEEQVVVTEEATPEPTPTETPTPEPTPEEVRPEDISIKFVEKPSLSGYQKIVPLQAGHSSELVQDAADDPNNVWMAMDGDEVTSWQEGVDGPGIGEYIWYGFESERKVKYISFQLGNWRTQRYAEGNNRPRELNIYLGELNMTVEFPFEQKEYWIELSEAFPAEKIQIEIASVYKGTSWDDTCIAEIGIYGE